MTFRVALGVPPHACSPNARTHWAAKARAVKAYRHEAYIEALKVLKGRRPLVRRALVRLTFFFVIQRKRDPDNLQASAKAAIDGLRDAGLLADDDHLTISTTVEDGSVANALLIEVEEL